MAEVYGTIGDQPVELNNAASEATLKALLEVAKATYSAGSKGGKTQDQKAQAALEKKLKELADAANVTSRSYKDQKAALDKAAKTAKNEASARASSAREIQEEAKTRSQSIREARKQAEGNKKSSKEVIGAVERVANGLMNTARDIQQMGNSISAATGILSGFVKQVPLVGGVLGSFMDMIATAIEGTQKSFMTAASVGANFGGSIQDMIDGATNVGMTFDQFSSIIQQNGEAIAFLGASSAEGAKRFVQAGTAMRKSGIQDQLAYLGYNTEAINEGMANYTLLLQRAGVDVRNLAPEELAERTGAYLTNLDAVSKLTGQSRKELEEQRQERQRDLRVRYIEGRLQSDSAKTVFNNMMDITKRAGPGLEKGFRDLFYGIPDSDEAKAFLLFNKEAGQMIMATGEQARRTGNLTTEQGDAMMAAMARGGQALKANENMVYQLGAVGQQFNDVGVGMLNLAQYQGKSFAELTQQQQDEVRQRQAAAKAADPAEILRTQQEIARSSNEMNKALLQFSKPLTDLLQTFNKILADDILPWIGKRIGNGFISILPDWMIRFFSKNQTEKELKLTEAEDKLRMLMADPDAKKEDIEKAKAEVAAAKEAVSNERREKLTVTRQAQIDRQLAQAKEFAAIAREKGDIKSAEKHEENIKRLIEMGAKALPASATATVGPTADQKALATAYRAMSQEDFKKLDQNAQDLVQATIALDEAKTTRDKEFFQKEIERLKKKGAKAPEVKLAEAAQNLQQASTLLHDESAVDNITEGMIKAHKELTRTLNTTNDTLMHNEAEPDPTMEGIIDSNKKLTTTLKNSSETTTSNTVATQANTKETKAASACELDYSNPQALFNSFVKIMTGGGQRPGQTAGTTTTGAVAGVSPGGGGGAPVDISGEIGSMSQKYESGSAGSMAVGWDKSGGTSYGKYQIASRVGSMDAFLKILQKNDPEAHNRLMAAGPQDAGVQGKFAQEWKKLVGEGKIQKSEREFAVGSIYNPAMKGLKDQDLSKMISENKGLQEMMFSMAIQHGPGGAPAILNKVYKKGMTPAQLAEAAYAERGAEGGKRYFSRSSEAERAGVVSRFGREKQDVLALLGQPGQPVSPTAVAAAPGTRPAGGTTPSATQVAAAVTPEAPKAGATTPNVPGPAAPAAGGAGTTSNLASLMEDLNSNVRQLVALTNQQLDVSRRTLSATKSNSSDLYSAST